MAIKQIPISLLTVGMHVTKIDISWIDSPFMYHHLTIKSKSQIEKLLKAGVKNISIDTSKGIAVGEISALSNEKTSKLSKENTLDLSKEKPAEQVAEIEFLKKPKDTDPAQVVESVSIEKEMSAAKALMGQVTKLVEDINKALERDESVDSKQIAPLIDDTLDSLKRNDQAIATLVNMQRKDKTLADHVFSTFSLVLSLALKLELDDEAKQSLALAAFFHDSGWLKLPLHLLGKKKAYTASESKLIQQHVALGLKTLSKNCELSELVIRIISEHHENFDGSGYPKKLKESDMHDLSKLFTVVVRYDEFVHGLLDKPAKTPNGVLALLYKEAKLGRIDTKAVSALVSLLSIYPVGSAVQLSNKEKAVVIDINQEHPKQPSVKVFYDISGMAHAKAKVVDLAHQNLSIPLQIVSVLNTQDAKVDPAGILGSDI